MEKNYKTQPKHKRKISAIASKQDVEDVTNEFVTRLGKLPKEVENLIDIAYIKNLASNLKITEVLCTNNQAYLQFEKREDIMNSEALGDAIYKFNKICSLDLSENPKIKFISLGISSSNYTTIRQFIEYANSIKNTKKD